MNPASGVQRSVVLILLLVFLPCTGRAESLPPPPTAVRPGDVIAHLARTISWYRHVDALIDATYVNDPVLHQSTHAAAVKALQLAFDFARTESLLLAASPQAESQPGNAGAASVPGSGSMYQALQRASERVAGIQARMAELETARASATAAARDRLTAQRGELQAQLNLAEEVRRTLQSVTEFSGNSGGGGLSGQLAAQISQLEALAPEARHADPKALATAGAPDKTTAPAPGSQASLYQPESAGLVTLLTEFISLSGSDTKTAAVIGETESLLAQTEALRNPLTTEIRSSIARSEELTNDSATDTVRQLNADQHEIEHLTARFRQLSAALVPIREQQIMMATTRTNLNEIHSVAARLRRDTTRYLLLRSATLGSAVLLLLALSAVWRKATFRYIRDVRRRRQFMLLRRVVVVMAVTVVIALGFISDFGSLATYAGFLTAGIAVALQNVILAVVAYFFLIGRYGVRIGDRVTISGVTGNVIDIGLVRIYLMEFAGLPGELHPTGRIVVFSNAVLFQPSALFKQMPGADFIWRSVILTLQADAPLELARASLTAAVDSVWEKYREAIEQQHAALERSVDLQMSVPHPDARLRYSDSGLEFVAHYPAEMQHAATTDDAVMKALYDAIAADPRLQLAAGGAPRLNPASA